MLDTLISLWWEDGQRMSEVSVGAEGQTGV